ncbi:VOC family protein [Amycolatopsis nigrescens]|uniref:VOC family protein n=1 Tax=Amycolatopsis nigrescens TaxID=381445 RepID=UPI00035DA2D0|nr:VOC family protein [Amycolatopsis nigrescens]
MPWGFQVTFDVADPARQARFWAVALGYELQKPPPGFDSWVAFAERIGLPRERWDAMAAVVDPEGTRPRLLFQRVPEGKVAKNRVHLDVHVSGEHGGTEAGWNLIQEHVRRLAEAGATVLHENHDEAGRCMVLQDPEGNEFCVQ